MVGESFDSALGKPGGKPESESDASDSLKGMIASITTAGDSSERGGPEGHTAWPPGQVKLNLAIFYASCHSFVQANQFF